MENGSAPAPQRIPPRLPAFCGTTLSLDDWTTILEIIDSCGVSRTEIASTICEVLGWTRPRGGLKTRECIVYLEDLEEKGVLRLPALRKTGRPRGRATSIHYSEAGEPRPEREGMLGDVAPVTLDLVTTHGERGLWRELVERYHYLGHKVPFGAHLRYLVRIATPRREVGNYRGQSSFAVTRGDSVTCGDFCAELATPISSGADNAQPVPSVGGKPDSAKGRGLRPGRGVKELSPPADLDCRLTTARKKYVARSTINIGHREAGLSQATSVPGDFAPDHRHVAPCRTADPLAVARGTDRGGVLVHRIRMD